MQPVQIKNNVYNDKPSAKVQVQALEHSHQFC